MRSGPRAASVAWTAALVAVSSTVAGIVMMATAGPTVATAGGSSGVPRGAATDTATRGTALVERFFSELESGDQRGLARLLSPAFQLQGADGGYLDEAEFLDDPPAVESLELSNVKATRAGKVIVVRYDVEAVVTIDGVPQSRAPAPRLSVFVQGKNGWQLVAHANFNVPAEEPQQ
jgi:Domain of unknown function (DUF4440)